MIRLLGANVFLMCLYYTPMRTTLQAFLKKIDKIFLVQFWATSLSTYTMEESEIFLQLLKK